MYRRNISSTVKEALRDSPVTLIHGARQTGKTTLAQQFSRDRRYLTLDDLTVLASATQNPAGFLADLDGPVVLDEVQRAPELFVAIKSAVDRDRTPGRFLLTGSANVLALPRLSESLAGRMEIVPLWPLSQGEVNGVAEGFLDAAFGGALNQLPGGQIGERELWQRVLVGGFPEALVRARSERRDKWFTSYVDTILQRDVRDLTNVQNLADLPRLLQLLATRVGGLLNYADIARSLSLPQTTVRRHFALFEATFLLRMLPPWCTNLGKRLVKSPKIYTVDTGLAASLLAADEGRLSRNPQAKGMLLENFVVMELTKQATWSRSNPRLFFYRTPAGAEVDVVAEDRSGAIVGIEVKAAASVVDGDFRGLRLLRQTAGDRMRCGILLYTGEQVVPFGEGMTAIPVSMLWASARA